MVQVVVMPKLGFNQDDGVLIKWYFKEGENVKKGMPLFAIETDKTTMDMEATSDGVVRKLLCNEGDTVPVTIPIAIVADADEDISNALADFGDSPKPKSQESEQKPDLPKSENKEDQKEPVIQRLTGESVYKELMAGKLKQEASKTAPATIAKEAAIKLPTTQAEQKISPRARRMAADLGLDLNKLTASIVGTGFDGGISGKDVMEYAKNVKTSPTAKAMAAESGVDIYEIAGSGSAGRVMKRDVKRAIERQGTGRFTAEGKEILEEIPYKGVRKIIGERLSQSMSDSPHIFFTQKVEMEALLKLRKQVNETQEQKTSVTDYVAFAAIIALQKYPYMNASLTEEKITIYSSVNLGIAVAAQGGLIVPVVKEAQKLSIVQLAAETGELIAKAREGHLSPEEYTGGTFTISNLGMFGIDNFTAIINPPEVGILAVSAVKDEPVVIKDEGKGKKKVAIKPMMNIQLSADHRVADGLLAAQFVKEIQKLLEAPLVMFI